MTPMGFAKPTEQARSLLSQKSIKDLNLWNVLAYLFTKKG